MITLKIMVTGGAGFIGSHVVDGLIEQGHQVVVVDNLATGKQQNLNPAARFYQLDICSPELEQIFRDEQVDYVDHHAAQIDVRRSVESPGADAQINIIGLLNIIANCQRYAVQGIVFASSGGVVYGEPEQLPATEEYPKGPLSPYGVSKLSSEYYLYYLARVQGIPYVALRYANVYGPRQDPWGEAGVVAIFGQKMLRGEIPTIYGDGEQLRDYVYVGDIARANLLAIEQLAQRRLPATIDTCAYNIGTGQGTSVNQLFAMTKQTTGFNSEPVYGPERPGEVRQTYLDASKAAKELNWQPQMQFPEGLRQTMAYLGKNLA